MRSARPKVLHDLCGRPMLWHVLRALAEAGVSDVTVVTNADVLPHVAGLAAHAGHDGVSAVVQEPQRGTGHAVMVALERMRASDAKVVVLNGDMPLVDATLVRRALANHADGCVVVTARMPLPSTFGRIVREGAHVARIVEARDASEDELALDEMNAGLYVYDEAKLRAAVAELRDDNAQNEYYLTDTVAWMARGRHKVVPVVADDYRSVLGVNDRLELASASAALNRRLCESHMRAGVTIVDPATTYLEPGLELAADVTIRPNSTLSGDVSVGAHSEIGPNVRLQNARIGEHVVIVDSIVVDSEIGDFSLVGPWAHVRGGSDVGTGARLGNFVEVKASVLAAGVKAVHLAYLGDSRVGERTNVGAGTITCNYDGTTKHRTTIGRDVFIGSNSSIVAPVTIGDGAATGAGTVVIRDIAPGARVVGNPGRVIPRKDVSKAG